MRTIIKAFRTLGPYLASFRQRVFVVALNVRPDPSFQNLIGDLVFLADAGIRLVLVFDHRCFLLPESREEGPIDAWAEKKHLQSFGEALATLGAVFYHANAPALDMPMAVTAKPKGVVNGLDYGALGEMRNIETAPFWDNLQKGRIVIVGRLGFSPVGSTLILDSQALAKDLAIALSAVKLIYFLPKDNMPKAQLSTLTVKEAKSLALQSSPYQNYLKTAIHAIEGGVRRVHFLDEEEDGALLTELFTHLGSGVMITENPLGVVRPAKAEDLAAISSLIEPLANEGLLLARDKTRLEEELNYLYVLDNEGMIIGCAALYPFLEEEAGEFGCFAVHPDFRGEGAGELLLTSLTEEAQKLGIKRLYALTIKASHWFMERDFIKAHAQDLPKRRQATYDARRCPHTLVKFLPEKS
jgi:amino-acid N-acetyltransferase